MRLAEIRRALADGGPGFCQIALTNACNAACSFCGFARLPKEKWVFPETRDLKQAIGAVAQRGIGYLILVGGEPLLHPGLCELIAFARTLGLASLICTNGSLLRQEDIERLHEAGLNWITISVDAPSEERHDENRGIPGLCGRIREANRLLRQRGYDPTASVTISRLVGDFDLLPDFVRRLGFGKMTFSYPQRYLGSGYLGFSSSPLIDFSREELIGIFEKLIELKRQMPVLNPRRSLEEMIRALKGKKPHFPCLAGYKYFHVDWNLDLFRCHYASKPMCKACEFASSDLIRDDCTACMIDCYRDASVLQLGAVAVADALGSLRRGRLREAARRLFGGCTLGSWRCVFEERSWIWEFSSPDRRPEGPCPHPAAETPDDA